ncbi:MAG: ribonuclease Y [Candidatus Moranbacteria bacterium]|nr:ribonuclease Y [Candidatus Moranbacteria bacterium]MBP6034466.1 ribonuclease Y [Candidatus Moranbacteria bacterium]MBP7696102.1 ribonuclease Y [Candidatus Moranbacteria bacterium]
MFGVANLLIGIVLLGGGAVVGYFIRQNIAKKQLETAEGQAEKILGEAARKAEETVLEAKKKSVDILEEAKKNEKEREQKLAHQESRVEKREEQLDRKSHDLEKHEETLMQKAEGIKVIKEEVERLKADELVRLQQISGLSKEEAVERIYKVAEEESRDVLVKRLSKLEHENAEELEKRALSIMGTVIQKYARSHVSEFTTSTVQIPSDEVKGKIIGKEGRNIRALEKETGVEMIVDDTPESVIISSFDPVRREIARIALEKLIEDGRIHPARIEEAVAEAKKDIDQKIREAGEAAAYDAGVAGLHPKLLYILGRLRYRYSYKQNILLHSLEVSYLSGAIAAELGANVAVAKKAGLLHDIGKAVDHEIEGTHVKIGMRILEKFNIGQDVIDAMKCHHDEYPHETLEAFIITAADAISASRPGARKETAEKYIKRLQELEALVNSFPQVEKSFAIQAGREVRVFVSPEKTDDLGAMNLAKEIAKRIEEELQYPGEIRVNVYRETRAVEYAR